MGMFSPTSPPAPRAPQTSPHIVLFRNIATCVMIQRCRWFYIRGWCDASPVPVRYLLGRMSCEGRMGLPRPMYMTVPISLAVSLAPNAVCKQWLFLIPKRIYFFVIEYNACDVISLVKAWRVYRPLPNHLILDMYFSRTILNIQGIPFLNF